MQTSNEATMPFPVPTNIIGKPTEKSITTLHTQLLANARSIHSDEGDGLLGHAIIVLTTFWRHFHEYITYVLHRHGIDVARHMLPLPFDYDQET